MGDEGTEHTRNSPENPPVPDPSGADSSALAIPSDLADVVNAWSNLPPALKMGVLAMIKAAQGGDSVK